MSNRHGYGKIPESVTLQYASSDHTSSSVDWHLCRLPMHHACRSIVALECLHVTVLTLLAYNNVFCAVLQLTVWDIPY